VLLVHISPIPSVGLSVRKVYCGKAADWIRMEFQLLSGVARVMGVLDGGPRAPRERRFPGFSVSIGLNGACFEQKCIRLVSIGLGMIFVVWAKSQLHEIYTIS